MTNLLKYPRAELPNRAYVYKPTNYTSQWAPNNRGADFCALVATVYALQAQPKPMTEQQMTAWIDQASYYDLLKHHRFAPVGDPYFVGAIGEHYYTTMRARKAALNHNQQVRISKQIGYKHQ